MSDFDSRTKITIYRLFAESGRSPSADAVAERMGSTREEILAAYGRLFEDRFLLLGEDGESIRIAPPFSGVPTQHTVESEGRQYYANCAWDSFGIPAALGQPARVRSRCEESLEPLELEVTLDGPILDESLRSWRFHSLVPAAEWWDDLVFT